MVTSDMRPWDHEDTGGELVHALFGDDGPWMAWLPEVLRSIVGNGRPDLIPRPRPDRRDDVVLEANIFGPILPLLHFRLGWPRVDVGVDRWVTSGRADLGDPTLSFLATHWGDHVLAFARWCLYSTYAPQAWTTDPVGAQPRSPVRESEPVLDDDDVLASLGSRSEELARDRSDPFHLSGHWRSALTSPEHDRWRTTHRLTVSRPGHAVLTLNRYAGWYSVLTQTGRSLPALKSGRSWRIDVLILPIGWIGEFRRSRDTGRWFAGRHAAHSLGDPKA